MYDQFRPNTSSTAKFDCSSDGREIPRLIWKVNVHITAHKTLPVDPILSQLNSVYTVSNCNVNIQDPIPYLFFITLVMVKNPSTSKSPCEIT
jgi:hypothetical protein